MANVKSRTPHRHREGSGKKGNVNISTPRNWGRKNSVLGGASAAAQGATRKSGK